MLHGRRDVAVMVEGRRYPRMAKPLSWPAFRMYPGEQELCRVAMAEVMEPLPMRRLSACPPFLSAQFLDRPVRECGGASMIGDLNRKPDLV